jgi:hypothetical protein
MKLRATRGPNLEMDGSGNVRRFVGFRVVRGEAKPAASEKHRTSKGDSSIRSE